jgi:hypothetical protein
MLKNKNVIRWLAFLPISSLIALIVLGIFYLISYMMQGDILIYFREWFQVNSFIYSQLVFIYISWRIIPSHKKEILYILLIIRIGISLIWFIELNNSNGILYLDIVQEFFMVVSSLLLINLLTSKEKN